MQCRIFGTPKHDQWRCPVRRGFAFGLELSYHRRRRGARAPEPQRMPIEIDTDEALTR